MMFKMQFSRRSRLASQSKRPSRRLSPSPGMSRQDWETLRSHLDQVGEAINKSRHACNDYLMWKEFEKPPSTNASDGLLDAHVDLISATCNLVNYMMGEPIEMAPQR